MVEELNLSLINGFGDRFGVILGIGFGPNHQAEMQGISANLKFNAARDKTNRRIDETIDVCSAKEKPNSCSQDQSSWQRGTTQ